MNYTRHFQCPHIHTRLLVLLESIAGVLMAMLCGEATVRSATPTGNLHIISMYVASHKVAFVGRWL